MDKRVANLEYNTATRAAVSKGTDQSVSYAMIFRTRAATGVRPTAASYLPADTMAEPLSTSSRGRPQRASRTTTKRPGTVLRPPRSRHVAVRLKWPKIPPLDQTAFADTPSSPTTPNVAQNDQPAGPLMATRPVTDMDQLRRKVPRVDGALTTHRWPSRPAGASTSGRRQCTPRPRPQKPPASSPCRRC